MFIKLKAYTALGAVCMVLACAITTPARAVEASPEIEIPAWFKNSFLDLREDLKEAAAAKKRVMVYFGQNGCPYCKRLMEVNFKQSAIVAKTRRHFDAIDINIYGSREVVWLDGKARGEKDFAALLKVQFTPTLLFLDEQGGIALRVNGYFPPERFNVALDYVAGRHERTVSFADYQAQHLKETAAAPLRAEPFFRKPPFDLDRRQPATRPLAIFFEQANCADCDEMHATALKAKLTRDLLSRFDVYQLDLKSDAAVITPGGTKTSAAQWARELKVLYAPSVVFFDAAGAEVFRVEAYVRMFHLQSSLDYVATGAYRKEPNFQRYIQARAEAIRSKGGRIDLMK